MQIAAFELEPPELDDGRKPADRVTHQGLSVLHDIMIVISSSLRYDYMHTHCLYLGHVCTYVYIRRLLTQ